MSRRVIYSINNIDGTICVDIFVRHDGSHGFETYRRDVEDPDGWFPIGGYSAQEFSDQEAALEAASELVVWLHAALQKRG
jgi:hypothetical protein